MQIMDETVEPSRLPADPVAPCQTHASVQPALSRAMASSPQSYELVLVLAQLSAAFGNVGKV